MGGDTLNLFPARRPSSVAGFRASNWRWEIYTIFLNHRFVQRSREEDGGVARVNMIVSVPPAVFRLSRGRGFLLYLRSRTNDAREGESDGGGSTDGLGGENELDEGNRSTSDGFVLNWGG